MALEWTFAEMRIFGALLLAACIPLCFAPSRRFLARWCSRVPSSALTLVLVAFTVIVVAYALLGLVWPVYPDDVEKDLVAIAWWWANGHSMYPDGDTLKDYGLFPYGPLCYEIIGASLRLFGPSVFASVIPSIFALVVSAAGMVWLAEKAGASRWRALVVAMLVIVAVRTMWPWARPDPTSIAVVVLACMLAFNRKGWAIVIGVGLLAGLSSALKLHGLLYVAPALALMAGTTVQKLILRGLVMAPFVALAAFAPFLVPGADFDNYLFTLRQTAQDGGTLGILLSNLLYIGMFLGAALLVPRSAWTGPGEDPLPPEREKLLVIALIIAGIGVSYAGSKHGAGPHHLVPFLPFVGIIIARRLGSVQAITGEARFLFLAFLIGLHPVSEIWKTTQSVFANWQMQDAGRRQIEEFARAHPDRRLTLVIFPREDGHLPSPPEDPYSQYLYVAFTGAPMGHGEATPETMRATPAAALWLVPARGVKADMPDGCTTTPGEPFNVVDCSPR